MEDWCSQTPVLEVKKRSRDDNFDDHTFKISKLLISDICSDNNDSKNTTRDSSFHSHNNLSNIKMANNLADDSHPQVSTHTKRHKEDNDMDAIDTDNESYFRRNKYDRKVDCLVDELIRKSRKTYHSNDANLIESDIPASVGCSPFVDQSLSTSILPAYQTLINEKSKEQGSLIFYQNNNQKSDTNQNGTDDTSQLSATKCFNQSNHFPRDSTNSQHYSFGGDITHSDFILNSNDETVESDNNRLSPTCLTSSLHQQRILPSTSNKTYNGIEWHDENKYGNINKFKEYKNDYALSRQNGISNNSFSVDDSEVMMEVEISDSSDDDMGLIIV